MMDDGLSDKMLLLHCNKYNLGKYELVWLNSSHYSQLGKYELVWF